MLTSGLQITAPIRQAHVWLFRINAFVDNLCRSFSRNGPMHLVLYGLEKEQADVLGRVVINAGCVNISDLLVEAPLRRPNVLNSARQFLEIIKWLIGVLQTLVVHRESLDDVLANTLCCPHAKLHAAMGFDSIPDGNDDIEVVGLGGIVLAVSGSC